MTRTMNIHPTRHCVLFVVLCISAVHAVKHKWKSGDKVAIRQNSKWVHGTLKINKPYCWLRLCCSTTYEIILEHDTIESRLEDLKPLEADWLEKYQGYEKTKNDEQGTMSTVYKTKKVDDETVDALLKIISKRQCPQQQLDYAEREITFLDQLKGVDHVVQKYDSMRGEDKVAIVMEYCNGGNLQEYKTRKGLTTKQKCIFTVQMFKALAATHDPNVRPQPIGKGIIHRDIKPENFVVNVKDGEAEIKLIDFGVARYIDEKDKREFNIGTVQYRAPETFVEYGHSTKSDVWAIGACVWEMWYEDFFYETVIRPGYIRINPNKYNITREPRVAEVLWSLKDKMVQDPNYVSNKMRTVKDWLNNKRRRNFPRELDELFQEIFVAPDKRTKSAADLAKMAEKLRLKIQMINSYQIGDTVYCTRPQDHKTRPVSLGTRGTVKGPGEGGKIEVHFDDGAGPWNMLPDQITKEPEAVQPIAEASLAVRLHTLQGVSNI